MKWYLGLFVFCLLGSQLRAEEVSFDDFRNLFSKAESAEQKKAYEMFDNNWKNSYVAPIIEMLRFRDQKSVRNLLVEKTEQNFGRYHDSWYDWIWKNDFGLPSWYPLFKRTLYSKIDRRFEEYFDTEQFQIRLDEVRWGGVRRDGIPPLKNPKMITAKKATYLDESNIVFGVAINGDFRAYPKRILAWHEMFKDEVGGVSIAGVYCTLCGTVILYETNFKGKHHELGTSGFLYRSNKLMYDHATKSMWSTLEGQPVIGMLVGKGIQLETRPVVTTTWGEWRKQHPETTVLSLETGHNRDYGEGVAYHDYFSTDKLMFSVPKLDKRLKNKDEVFVLRFGNSSERPKAIAADFLTKNPIYQAEFGGEDYVVFTDKGGANRAYQSGGVTFTSFDSDKGEVMDKSGATWKISEDKLTNAKLKKSFKRLSAHRAFWFGWYAVHPDTILIK